MAGPKVAFIHGLPEKIVDVITPYTPEGFTTFVIDGNLPEEDQVVAVQDADFIILYGTQLAEHVFRSATKARLVQLLAAGYDTVDLGLLRELGIPCANNGGANSWAVADHAVLLILSLYRRLVLLDTSTRAGTWNAPIDGFNTFEMANKLVGLIGIGNIGRQVARRVQGFDATAQYYDKYPLPPDREQDLNITGVPLDELFQTSDIVSCHTPLTPETYHLVNRERIALMKSTAVLINTSRGPVVDEAALIEALQEGRIAGAGLDVFEEEPVDPGNPLLGMDNVVVTPHSAGTTWNTWFRRAEFAYQNIERVWAGQPPLAVVSDHEG